MTLKQYFEGTKGIGVLSTANEKGQVDSAIYARPHFMDDGTIAFIMADRRSHAYLQSNPHAAYLFMEEGPGYKGKRLGLTKVREEQDTPLIDELRRRTYEPDEEARMKPLSLVYFEIEEERPLVGAL